MFLQYISPKSTNDQSLPKKKYLPEILKNQIVRLNFKIVSQRGILESEKVRTEKSQRHLCQ